MDETFRSHSLLLQLAPSCLIGIRQLQWKLLGLLAIEVQYKNTHVYQFSLSFLLPSNLPTSMRIYNLLMFLGVIERAQTSQRTAATSRCEFLTEYTRSNHSILARGKLLIPMIQRSNRPTDQQTSCPTDC